MNRVLILVLLFSKFCLAEEIYFSCERYQSCFNNECNTESKNFDFQINTKTGEMSNFPIFISPVCRLQDNLKISYSIDDRRASTVCETGNSSSVLTLSRRSLKLDVTNTYQREGVILSTSSSTCKKANKKQF